MKKLLFIFLTFILLISSSYSETKNTFYMHNFDDSSCGAWTQSNNNPQLRHIYIQWFRGFLSGYNYGDEKYTINSKLNYDTISLYIDKFCRENPLRLFTSATIPLVKELRVKQ